MKKIQDLGKMDVIHCPTLKEAKLILEMAHGLGLKWENGDSFLKDHFWNFCKEATAYALHRGTFGCVGHYEVERYTIHRASEFLNDAGKPPLISSEQKIYITGVDAVNSGETEISNEIVTTFYFKYVDQYKNIRELVLTDKEIAKILFDAFNEGKQLTINCSITF